MKIGDSALENKENFNESKRESNVILRINTNMKKYCQN